VRRALIVDTHLITRRSFRDQIHLHWDYRCSYCNEPLGRSPTLDHVHPKALGGPTERNNLVSCCLRCQSSKGSRPWLEWFRAQPFHCGLREAAITRWLAASVP
jgi:5-methylcytosine-specific restriction endonuclease McrA